MTTPDRGGVSDESPMVGPYHCDCCGRVRPADDAYPQPDRRVLCGNCDSGDQPGCANCNGMTGTARSSGLLVQNDQGDEVTEQADGRWCRRCGDWRSFSDFADDDLNTPCTTCRERKLAQQRERRWAAGPDSTRASHLWRKYRITPTDYDALRAQQGNRCAICQVHEDAITRARGGRPRVDGTPAADNFKLVVDHCHTTGRVRGLLCSQCNSLIGLADEKPQTLIAAAEYVGRQPTFESSAPPLFDDAGEPAA